MIKFIERVLVFSIAIDVLFLLVTRIPYLGDVSREGGSRLGSFALVSIVSIVLAVVLLVWKPYNKINPEKSSLSVYVALSCLILVAPLIFILGLVL